jgi:hypothetical protein
LLLLAPCSHIIQGRAFEIDLTNSSLFSFGKVIYALNANANAAPT